MTGDTHRFAAGSYTFGYFWTGRNYNIYRMHLADGTLFGHRFDILRDVRILADRLEWTDLLVDVWCYADGRREWKDEAQMAEYIEKGWMTPADADVVRRTRQDLEENLPAIIAEAGRLLERISAGSGG